MAYSLLAMLPSSAIQVVENSRARLIVWNPPYYSLGAAFVVLGLVTFVVLLLVGRSQPARRSLRLGPLVLMTGPFVAVGFGLLTSQTVVTFSRDADEVSVQDRFFGVSSGTVKVPLGDVRFATVETSRGSRKLVLVCQSGRAIGIGVFSSQGGQYAAANAINDFLGTHGSP